MKRNGGLAIVSILIGLTFGAFGADEGKTLDECYQAALKRSEVVASSQESIRQAEQVYNQAIGSVLPQISGVGAYQFQQGTPQTFGTLYPNPSTSSKLTVTQPLFQGFKEFAGLSQTKTLVRASELDKKQASAQLYIDTSLSFFTVASMEHDLDNINEELSYYEKRIKELNQFRAIGRSQVTDVLTAQAQQLSLRAQSKQLTGQLRAQRAVLAFLTGFAPDVAIARPKDTSPQPKPLETYLSRLDSRPDVQAEQERAKASAEGIPIARAGHFPTLGVQGDYFFERTGALKDVSWDVLFQLTVPIFSGGIVSAQVEQAVSKRDQAELQVSRTKRLAEQQIRQYFENFNGDKEQFEAYHDANEIAEKNYKEELREYRLGLVTNLDVLNALTTFQESKRAFDKARYSMLLDVEELAAAGAFKPEAMKNMQ